MAHQILFTCAFPCFVESLWVQGFFKVLIYISTSANGIDNATLEIFIDTIFFLKNLSTRTQLKFAPGLHSHASN